jgi:predicted nuclease with TOPRIM domain
MKDRIVELLNEVTTLQSDLKKEKDNVKMLQDNISRNIGKNHKLQSQNKQLVELCEELIDEFSDSMDACGCKIPDIGLLEQFKQKLKELQS